MKLIAIPMKKVIKNWIYSLFLFGIMLMFAISCKKEDDSILSETVTDIDGNIYKTVQIGTQIWMAENLKTTKYNDGNPIQNITDGTVWMSLTSGAYCWYNNDIINKITYGALYNWYTVNTSKLAPAGWHVPTDVEWTTLTTYLGGTRDEFLISTIVGEKLKETGTSHWLSPNEGATNESGFTSLPGGDRNGNDGTFGYLGNGGIWWSSTNYDSYSSWFRYLSNSFTGVSRSYDNKAGGFSVRCVKN